MASTYDHLTFTKRVLGKNRPQMTINKRNIHVLMLTTIFKKNFCTTSRKKNPFVLHIIKCTSERNVNS